MKTLAIALLVIGAAAISAVPALAVVLYTETFSYPDGDLTVQSGYAWTTHSGTGTDIQVVGGVAVGDMSNAPDDNRLFPAPRGATDLTYACFRVMIPAVTGTPGQNYFAHFRLGNLFRSKVWVAPTGSTFTFGLSVGGNVLVFPTGAVWPVALNYDQWYTIVTLFDAGQGVSKLWVDPVNEASPSITATDAQSVGTLIESFAMRQSNTASVLWKFKIDDLGVGSTFNDACSGLPVPTSSSTWGQLKSVYR